MSANKKIETIMIELDVLLDTRLGTIRRLGEDLATKALTPEYLVRDCDVFEGVDTQAFKTLYAARDVETLKHSLITALVPCLQDITSFLREMAISRPFFDGVKIALNVYPYRLSDAERKELVLLVSAWTGALVPIELINIPPVRLTPYYVKSNFSMLFMYDYGSWMDIHSEAFIETRIPEIHLVAPAIYFNEKPDEKTLKELIRNAAHPLQATQMLANPLVGLELIDIKYFSIIDRQAVPA